jgi:Kef-type K+ transport system membrane component KefB/mannitol/fructose-specific phosphotransferase system IIA component (Ntr-type)
MPVLPQADPLLTLAIIIVAGVASGSLAKLVNLPSITGQILIGIVIGSGLHLFEEESVRGLQPVTHFALGLMAVSVGAHLNVKRMRNAGKRLTLLFLGEALLTPLVVVLIVRWLPGMDLASAFLLGAIAVSTAPATIIALVKETRSKGVFVKTLVAAVALNNMACILLFELARAFAHTELQEGAATNPALALVVPLLVPALLGTAAALSMHAVNRFVVRPDVLSTAGILAILLTSGLSDYLGASPLLSCLFLGIVQTNLTPAREKLVDSLFANFQPAILAIFFTLAGMSLHFDQARTFGLIALAYFLARTCGKLVSTDIAMRLAGATTRVRQFLGLASLPQAGLAIGLVLLLQDDQVLQAQEGRVELLLGVVLTAVTLNELIGPVLTRLALKRSGELGMDRSRLLDFIQEENILTDFVAATKEEAIERLVDHMIRSHHLNVDRQTLLASVLEREAQASTCLGGGLAVPHVTLPGDHAMVGVMALSREGLGIPSPDGRPVHCIALFGTSVDERQRHLQVLATLARTIGTDPSFQDRLFNATTPAHASEILHGEESEHFNYFLEDEA